MIDVTLFYAFAALAIACALAVPLSTRSHAASALAFSGSLLAVAGIFVLLEAFVVALVVALVGAVATGVLLGGVAALVDARPRERDPGHRRAAQAAGVLLALAALAGGAGLFVDAASPLSLPPEGFGGHRAVGVTLYADGVLLIALLALLVLAAVVGGLAVALPGEES